MWAALDAEFYLALAAGRPDCEGLIDEVNCGLILLPTAYQEIADLCFNTNDEEIRTRSLDALRFMSLYGVLAAPHPSKNLGMDDGLAKALIESGVLHNEQKNAALILAEAACEGVSYLLTLDPDIAGVKISELKRLIDLKDLNHFEIKTVS